MPTTITLPQIHTVALGGETIIRVNYTDRLGGSASSTTISSATAVDQASGTSTLGITGFEPNDATYTDNGATVGLAKAVWFRVIPTLAGTYSVLVTATTNSTNPGREVLPYLITIVVS